MKSPAGKAQRNVLRELIALSVDNQIRIEAMEQVLVKTNPMVHELYLGLMETLRKQKAVKLNRGLAEIPKKS